VKLLLDSHVPVALVEALARTCPSLDCVHLRDWQARRWLNAPDSDLLLEAAREGWTLVTYDLRTIVPLLRRWAEAGQSHAGVILVDDASIPSYDVGGLAAALRALWQAQREVIWRDRVQFLTRRA
jgi:hypothetical protein